MSLKPPGNPNANTNTSGLDVPAGWFDVKASYGAAGDGVTDDSAAILAAWNAAKVGGGTVYFPPGLYIVASPLVLKSNTRGVTFRGAGGGWEHGGMASRLRYTGTTTGQSGGLMSFHGTSSIELCYLGFEYSSASFTGDLVQFDGRATVFADVQDFHVHHCSSRSTQAGQTANSMLRLSAAIIGEVDHCQWTGGVYNILIGDAGGVFVNNVNIQKNVFNFGGTAHIGIGTSDGEAIQIRDNTFEAGTNTPGIKGLSGNALYAPIIEGNWFGDASGNVDWISGIALTSNTQPLTVRGNFFAGPGTGTHLGLASGGVDGNGGGIILFEGNQLGRGTAFNVNASTTTIVAIGNQFNEMSAMFESGDPPVWIGIGNKFLTNSPFLAKMNDNSLGGVVRLGLDAPGTIPDKESVTDEQLVIGAAGAAQDVGGPGMVYTYHSGGNLFATALQAPTSPAPTTREAQMLAGDPPVANVRVRGDAIGFFNTTPVTRPAAYTVTNGTTDRSYDADTVAVAELADVVHTLIADLKAYGLLQ